MSIAVQPPAAIVTGTQHSPRPNKKKKGSDPFLELATDNVKPLDTPSVATDDQGNVESHTDTIFADFILAPLNMVSFIVSLFLVDRQQRQWRLSQHASNPDGVWSRLTHWSWLDPQPYQDPQSGSWGHSHAPSAAQSPPSTSYHGWYARKKHRAMAKMEMSDAFAIRKRVVIALVVWATVGFLALSYAARRTYAWLGGP